MGRLKHREDHGRKKDSYTEAEINCQMGRERLSRNLLFERTFPAILIQDRSEMGRILASTVSQDGWIYLNRDVLLEPAEWEYIIIFQQLHLIFGHFDAERMPNHGYQLDRNRWELACNIYNQRFLSVYKYSIIFFNQKSKCENFFNS